MGSDAPQNSRAFDIGDVLSVTTGVLVSERGMEAVYDILNFLTGDNLLTHQLGRAADEMRSVIFRQHRALANISADGVTRDNWRAWLADQKTRYPTTYVLVPAKGHEHESIDPLSELAEHVHPSRIIVVKP